MTATSDHLASLFYRGQFTDIIAAAVDGSETQVSDADLVFVLGALAFSGRVEDAVAIYEVRQKPISGSNHDEIAIQFFLGIGQVRVSKYEVGARILRRNFQLYKEICRIPQENPDSGNHLQSRFRAGFYAHQGLAFLRFFESRFSKALLHSERAWRLALLAKYGFGQALAADLRGHGLVLTGRVTRGIESLNRALTIATRLENSAVVYNLKSSIAYYRSRHGLDGTSQIADLKRPNEYSLANLKSLIQEFNPQDNFSLAAAQVELSRQFAIRGDLDGSERLLRLASPVILAAKHSRHSVRLYLRRSHNRFLAGDFAAALMELDRAEPFIDQKFDLVEQLMTKGLRFQILSELGETHKPAAAELQVAIRSLTARTGLGIGANILWRLGEDFRPSEAGDDPLGDLKNLASPRGVAGYEGLLRLVSAGLYGFLNESLRFGAGARVVCLDLLPGQAFVFNRGNVTRSSENFSQIMKSILIALAKGRRSKSDMVESFWGYPYNPTRHDAMLYAVISRIRRALGQSADWVRADGQYYQLETGVLVHVYEHQTATIEKLRARRQESTVPDFSNESGHLELNYRQLAILDAVKGGEHITARWCVDQFSVSRITAGRDLGILCKMGLLARFGQARVTTYIRIPGTKP